MHTVPVHRCMGCKLSTMLFGIFSLQDLQAPTSEDAYQQELLSCGLALAMLGSACRLPDLAGSEEMIERIPALVKVRELGGVHAHSIYHSNPYLPITSTLAYTLDW